MTLKQLLVLPAVLAAAGAGADAPSWTQAQGVRGHVLSSPVLAMAEAERVSGARAVEAELGQEDGAWTWTVGLWRGAAFWEASLALNGRLLEIERADAEEQPRAKPRITAAQALVAAAKWRQGFAYGLELEREDGRLQWEASILTRSGQDWEVEIDARTGDIIEVEPAEED